MSTSRRSRVNGSILLSGDDDDGEVQTAIFFRERESFIFDPRERSWQASAPSTTLPDIAGPFSPERLRLYWIDVMAIGIRTVYWIAILDFSSADVVSFFMRLVSIEVSWPAVPR